ncbi:Ubiquitin family protein [Pelomyxa schiedti]|nr:Ubiquitin family protein [Pelomyxa schiedti]
MHEVTVPHNWFCNVCHSAHLSQRNPRFRCGICFDYDQCEACQRVPHQHPLKLIQYDLESNWSCSHCAGRNPAKRFTCTVCDWNLCEPCLVLTAVRYPSRQVAEQALASWIKFKNVEHENSHSNPSTFNVVLPCGLSVELQWNATEVSPVAPELIRAISFLFGSADSAVQLRIDGSRIYPTACQVNFPMGISGPPLPTDYQNDTCSMQLFVKSLSGQIHSFTVSPDCTLGWLMLLIQVQTGTPINQQRLIFGGKQLDPDSTLADNNVAKESTLHLVLRLCKPVICFFPPTNSTTESSWNLTTTLTVKGMHFTVLHPHPQATSPQGPYETVSWKLELNRSGIITCPMDTRTTSHAYLFWEADVSTTDPDLGIHSLSAQVFCIEGSKAADFLDAQLTLTGLPVRERTDLITYSLDKFLNTPYILFRFVPEAVVNTRAPLQIESLGPTTTNVQVHRIWILWQGCKVKHPTTFESPLPPSMLGVSVCNTTIPRDNIVVVEWGLVNIPSAP